MRKAIIAVVTAAIGIAPTPLLTTFSGLLASEVILAAPAPVAHADPLTDPKCGGLTGQDYANCAQAIQRNLQANLEECESGPSHGWTAAMVEECENAVRSHNQVAPPPQATTQAPTTTPVQAPTNSPTMPVQAPITTPAQAPVTKPAVVASPKSLDASPKAIAAAKASPAARVDPANPPKPATQKDFTQQVQGVVNAHSNNVDVVNADNQVLARPRHWGYIDYDVDHRPALYNPITEAMTFRYFYSGAYRDVYVPAGGRIVLDVTTVGVYPFTAVSDSYLTSGSFYGGGTPPAVYRDVSAYIPAANQTVQVPQVTAVGHDDSQPAGSQDTFMLNDSTLAWGQANNPSDGGQVTVTKTQSLPGVGPTDNGGVLVALAAHQQPTRTWWPWLLGGGVLVIVVGLVAWAGTRRKGERI